MDIKANVSGFTDILNMQYGDELEYINSINSAINLLISFPSSYIAEYDYRAVNN